MPRTPLIDPEGYFADRPGGRIRLLAVFLLVLTGTLFSFHIVMKVVVDQLGEIQDLTETQIQAQVSILSFQWTLGTLLTLAVVTVLVHVLGSLDVGSGASTDGEQPERGDSAPDGGAPTAPAADPAGADRAATHHDGSMKDAFVVSLWGFVPGVLLLPARAAYAYVQAGSASISTEEAEPVVAEIETLSTVGSDPVLLGLVVVSVLWGVYIVGQGLRQSHGTERLQAFAVAAVAGALVAFAWFDGVRLAFGAL